MIQFVISIRAVLGIEWRKVRRNRLALRLLLSMETQNENDRRLLWDMFAVSCFESRTGDERESHIIRGK
jgi:hypothetical protein